MKRLVVIAEGETEESFVNNILIPYFNSLGIYNCIQCFKTKHSNGGLSKYSYIRQDIIQTIYEADVVVTTMLDFYRLPSDFPGSNQFDAAISHGQQVEAIENQMKIDIEQVQNRQFDNFIPYIQLHEFEALIFSSIAGIDALFERSEVDYRGLQNVIDNHPNPEDINNGPNTAPSVRLQRLIPGYDKVIYGVEIIKEIGIDAVLSKCPRFSKWIKKLKDALNETDF